MAHAGIVIGGLAVVLVMLSPLAVRRRRAALVELREAAATGNLVKLAELRAQGHDHLGHRTDRYRPALLIAVAGSLTAAGVHVWVCPEHFREGLRFGIFFLAVSIFQTLWTVAVVRRPGREFFRAGVVVNAGCVALWGISRTVGLPWGIAGVEPVGVLDLTATVAEVWTVFACAMCLGWQPRLMPHAVGAGEGREA